MSIVFNIVKISYFSNIQPVHLGFVCDLSQTKKKPAFRDIRRAAVHAAAGFISEISDLNFGVNVDSGVNAVNLILISLRTATGVVLYDCQL